MSSATTRKALRILLVEDDEDTRALTLIVLRSTGDHRVKLASSAERGLLYLRAECFDLLITDIGLPEMSGLEMLDHAVEEGLLPAATDILVCSGAHTCDRSGMLFMQKPVDSDALRDVIRASISRHELSA